MSYRERVRKTRGSKPSIMKKIESSQSLVCELPRSGGSPFIISSSGSSKLNKRALSHREAQEWARPDIKACFILPEQVSTPLNSELVYYKRYT